jgi:Zn-dependent protease/predicted transcriptional regulator
MEATFRLARIRGIEVGIHYSWFIAFVVFVAILARGQYPNTYDAWSETQYWTVAIITVLLLFTSVVLHEFGHALVAQSRNVPVRSITLFIFGGVAVLDHEAEKSGDEFFIAIAGPIVSIALGGLFGVAWLALDGVNDQLSALLSYLASINIILAVFNMIPGFPLDGGRVLRAIIWRITGSMRRATRIVATIGVGFGALFIFIGILTIATGNLVNGIWGIVLGWFLQNAAQQSQAAVEQEQAFRGFTVSELMNSAPVVVAPDVDLNTLAEDYILAENARGMPVMDAGRLVGIITVNDLKKVERGRWRELRVADVMTPGSELKVVAPAADLNTALQLMAENGYHQLPVVENGRLAGLLTRFEVVRFLQTRQELGGSG